eukprot:g6158.t1
MTLKNLKKLAKAQGGEPLDTLQQFVHHSVDDLCGRAPHYVEEYEKVVKVGSVNVHELADEMKSFTVETASLKEKSDIVDATKRTSGLSDGVCNEIASVLNARRDDILQALSEQAASVSSSHLADFDWSLRLVMSSNELSQMREPILILTLHISDSEGRRKEVVMELTKEKLGDLLSNCDKIGKVVEELTVAS